MAFQIQFFKRITSLFFGTGISKACQFAYVFLAAQLLSLESFGVYSICLTLMLIFLSPLLGFGSDLLVTSSVANNDSDYYYQAGIWRLIVFPFAGLILIVIGRIIYQADYWSLALAALLILARSIEQNVLSAVRGLGENDKESLYLSLSRFFSLVCLLGLYFSWPTIISIHSVFLIQIFSSLFLLPFLTSKELRLKPKNIDFSVLKRLLIEGTPLAISSITWLLYFKVDVLMLGKLLSNQAAGLYEFSYKILEATFILPSVIMIVYFRNLSSSDVISKYRRLFIQALVLLLFCGIAVYFLSFFIAPMILELIIKAEQLDSIGIFKILSFTIPFVFVGYLTTQVLVVQKQRMTYMWIMILGAFVNIALNLKFIPIYGALGAAYSTIGSEVMILILSLVLILMNFGRHLRSEN